MWYLLLLFIQTPDRTELTLNALKPSVETSVIAKRNFRNMETAAFSDDIKSACAGRCAQADGQQSEELVTSYNTCLSDCLDKHAPRRYVRVKNNSPHPWYDTSVVRHIRRTTHPWYDAEIDDAREKRKWENLWRRSNLEIHRQLYATRDDCATIISAKITEYYRGPLQNANNKNMFRILRSLDVHQMQLPEFCSTKEGCDAFSRFFQDKINKLLTNLHCHTA